MGKTFGGKASGYQQQYDVDEDEEYQLGNEDTAYSRKQGQRRQQSGKGGRRLDFNEDEDESSYLDFDKI